MVRPTFNSDLRSRLEENHHWGQYNGLTFQLMDWMFGKGLVVRQKLEANIFVVIRNGAEFAFLEIRLTQAAALQRVETQIRQVAESEKVSFRIVQDKETHPAHGTVDLFPAFFGAGSLIAFEPKQEKRVRGNLTGFPTLEETTIYKINSD